MTRRIVLTLADDTTETHCGSCLGLHNFSDSQPHRCDIVTTYLPSAGERSRARRHDRCLAAEAAASRLVEIAPDDADTIATIVDDWNRRCIPEADLPESIARIRDTLRDHAGPDR